MGFFRTFPTKPTKVLGIYYTLLAECTISPNSIIHHQISLSKQPPWRAAGDPRLARGRSRVRAPGPAGALRALFFLHPPFLPPSGGSFFRTFPTKPTKVLGLASTTGWVHY